MNKILVFIIAASIVACKEITFREPQPKGKRPLTSVPKNLQGKYLTFEEDGDLAKDTIVVTAIGYRFGYYDTAAQNEENKSHYDSGTLSDSLILKFHKGYYFLNFNENPEWLLRVLRQEKNGDLIYMAPEQENVDFKVYLKKLSAEIKIDSFLVNDEMLYQIDPSPDQLINLVERGYFSKVVLKKIR